MSLVSTLKPAEFWKHFEAISAIPRGSGNEAGIRNYIISIAEKNGLTHRVDEKGNLVVSKKATKGYEHSTGVVLQGHMDMVCEKNKGCNHDFTKDPIKFKIDGDFLKAQETSLGGDNGVGVAAALEIMVNKELHHPDLEFLFTVEEEVGLNGAKFLKGDFLKGKILLNLDSEEEGDFYIGCAGGMDGEVKVAIEKEDIAKGAKPFLLKATGMRGGHSGLEIHRGYANAIKVLTRVLWNLQKEVNLQIGFFSGGSKRNAIGREAEALIWLNEDKVNEVKAKIENWEKIIRKEFGKTEENLTLQLTETNDNIPEKAFSTKTAQTLLDVLYAMPHGVVNMSRDIPELVETSTNLGVVTTVENEVILTLNHRSSSDTAILVVAEGIEALARVKGVTYKRGPSYPGWQPDLSSRVLSVSKETYKKLFNKDAQIKAIHAGLECGIIGEKFPGMEMISFGPTMSCVHSPDEKLYIPSIEPFFKFLIELLKNLK